MWRDIFFSITAHVIVFGILIFSSTLNAKIPSPATIHRITAVTPQQIEHLIRNTPAVEKRTSNVPQVRTRPDEKMPKKVRRKKQAIKKTASQPVKQAGAKNKGSTVKGIKTDVEFEYPDYLIELRDRIFNNWRYPVLRETLMTTVYFRIARNGNIMSIRVEKATGNVGFDRSAWEAVQKSNPFAPLPEDFSEKELGVHFNFIYENQLK